ncbi:hypothetical protein KP509_14G040600 [Ceratopteris richardii]|uniref:EF-hand domain-containing protein n=1 Tax=Ceratopteris richardii TaxID=49495 RepID=A0A8T2TB83_CERRI|nr:hypothetical protein KP509_14G040600 [Ceratopteris richardii]
MAGQSSFTSRMHRAAALYYDSQPNAVQQELCTLFQRLDVDADGRITEAELKSFLNAPSLFAVLDSDGNGELDFEECKCLFFLLKQQTERCGRCEKLLLEGILYVCVECNAFHLCPTCYGARNNLRPVHPHSNFVLRPAMITGVINEIIDRDQRGVVAQPRSASQPRVVLHPRVDMSSATDSADPMEMWSVDEYADPGILSTLVDIVASGCSIMQASTLKAALPSDCLSARIR